MKTITDESSGFNCAAPTLMHLDLNSCFASVEQQANPLLRGKPVAVAAYTTPGGCILAASVEAKRCGVKTGMRVRDGLSLCPNLRVLPPDPGKYRFVNRRLLALLGEYTGEVEVCSIDEMVFNLGSTPALERRLGRGENVTRAMWQVGEEIKQRIKAEIGDWLTVSVGFAPNRYLAKTASGLHKPDGLEGITAANIEAVLTPLAVEELWGIKQGYGGRLRRFAINTALDLYRASIALLNRAFASITGRLWWMRLHGWEADDRDFPRRSFGHSYALYKPYLPSEVALKQILCQLVEKMGWRLRQHGYTAAGVGISCLFSDHTFWQHGQKQPLALYTSSELYRAAVGILDQAPVKPVRLLAVSCFNLTSNLYQQESLLEEETKKQCLTQALDSLMSRWGEFTVVPGRMLAMERRVTERIAFGGVADLEEVEFAEKITQESYFTP